MSQATQGNTNLSKNKSSNTADNQHKKYNNHHKHNKLHNDNNNNKQIKKKLDNNSPSSSKNNGDLNDSVAVANKSMVMAAASENGNIGSNNHHLPESALAIDQTQQHPQPSNLQQQQQMMHQLQQQYNAIGGSSDPLLLSTQHQLELIGRQQQQLQRQLQQPTSSLFQFPMFMPPPSISPQQLTTSPIMNNMPNMNMNMNMNNGTPNIMDFFQKPANIHGANVGPNPAPPGPGAAGLFPQQPLNNNNNLWQQQPMNMPPNMSNMPPRMMPNMPNFGMGFQMMPPIPGNFSPFNPPPNQFSPFGMPPMIFNPMGSSNQQQQQQLNIPPSMTTADYFLTPSNASPISSLLSDNSNTIGGGIRNLTMNDHLGFDHMNNSLNINAGRLPINELNQLHINEIANQFGSPMKVMTIDPLAKLEAEAQIEEEAEEDEVNEAQKKKLEKYTKVRPLLQPPSEEHKKELTSHSYDIFEKSKCEENRGRTLLIKLQNMVSKTFTKSQVKLHLFGSSANGMSLKGGDIDICMLVDSSEGDSDTIISKLATMLKQNNMTKVLAIPSARVPIVKFRDPIQNLSCDICINNKLALYNTRLVSDYSAIDERMRPLVYVVKRWAKRRKINEPFTGTLSSYAYINLVISFLQSRSPPVLPCLQQLANGPVQVNGIFYGEAMDDVIVDSYNCKYYNNIDKLKGFGSANKETLGELVFAFFETYSRVFNYATEVISIRTGTKLEKKKKEWESIQKKSHFCFSIEDPFEITHNLARVVKRSQLSTIIQEFNRAYKILSKTGNLHIVCRGYVEETPSSNNNAS